jgi:rubrerythrin
MSAVPPDQIAGLNRLLGVHAEAIVLYDHAIERCADTAVAEALIEFRADLARHLRDLAQAIVDLGGTPVVPRAREPKRAPRADHPLKSILATLRTIEQRAFAQHEEVASLTLPKSVWRIVERNLEDQRRHLDAIEQMIVELSAPTLARYLEVNRQGAEAAKP